MNTQSRSAEERIEGRVLQILSVRELVIDKGTTAGVERGMRFKVLAETPVQITALETDEVIDEVDRVKVRVQATEVRERISICKTYETFTTGGVDFGEMARRLMSPPRTLPVTLKAEDSQLPEPLPEEESYVKRGDRVVQILNDE